MNTTKHIKFSSIVWPDAFSGPSSYETNVRMEFLLDKDGKMFTNDDLYDIMVAYLHDEFNECPLKIAFDIQ